MRSADDAGAVQDLRGFAQHTLEHAGGLHFQEGDIGCRIQAAIELPANEVDPRPGGVYPVLHGDSVREQARLHAAGAAPSGFVDQNELVEAVDAFFGAASRAMNVRTLPESTSWVSPSQGERSRQTS